MKALACGGLFSVVLAALVSCTTTGGRPAVRTLSPSPVPGGPAVLLETFMDARPYQEQRGQSHSKLTIVTNDGDFSAKPGVLVEEILKSAITQRGIAVLDRGTGPAPLILSGEIRHLNGQIQLSRLPGTKQSTTSSFLPANFRATVQLLATLFDSREQRILFRKDFSATRSERHSMHESNPQEAKRRLAALVEECLREAALTIAQRMESEIRSIQPQPDRSR